jgi:hypothetical protein
MVRNPFASARVNPASDEGAQLAELYERAIRNYQGPATDIDALMFWAGRGRPEAMETVARLASGTNPSRTGPAVSGLGRDFDDIFITHATRTRPERVGNDFVLRPRADFDAENPWRHTVHFHGQDKVRPVSGGLRMNDWEDAPYLVAARLNDVLGANPRALNNLQINDIFMTPRFNEPIRIPNATLIEGTGSSARASLADYARSIGARSIDDAETALQGVARDRGIRYGMDFESPSWYYGGRGAGASSSGSEMGSYLIRDNSGKAAATDGSEFFYNMSPNLRERIYGQGRLSGMFDYIRPDSGLYNF